VIAFAFLLSLVPFALQIFFYGPALPILPFLPPIVLSLLLRSLSKTLFLSAACGFLIDLISADPFGIHALGYALTAALAARGRPLFSAESPVQLSLYTAICSFIYTPLHIALLFLFDRRVFFHGKWWLAEWTLLPALDALYALVWFAGPIALFRIVHRLWTHYWTKRKNPFPT